eukprot:gene13151-15527_t
MHLRPVRVTPHPDSSYGEIEYRHAPSFLDVEPTNQHESSSSKSQDTTVSDDKEERNFHDMDNLQDDYEEHSEESVDEENEEPDPDEEDDDDIETLTVLLLRQQALREEDPEHQEINRQLEVFLPLLLTKVGTSDFDSLSKSINSTTTSGLIHKKRKLKYRLADVEDLPKKKRSFADMPRLSPYTTMREQAALTQAGYVNWITAVRLTPQEFDALLNMNLLEDEYVQAGMQLSLRDLINEPYNFEETRTDFENSLQKKKQRKYSTEEQLYMYLTTMSSAHSTWASFTAAWNCADTTISRVFFSCTSVYHSCAKYRNIMAYSRGAGGVS